MNHNLIFFRNGFIAAGLSGFSILPAQPSKHPNVILIITDDQGYGDLGINGNPHVKTPVIDNLARQSIRFNNFYVCPVSAPTRAGLMTGRYSLRTGIRDTYNGGAMMAPSEVTIAEMLREAGYATGIFGKWHLGDNYPMRPCDQGFDESLIHLAGGMGQPGDFTTWPRGDSSYFDPILWHNGKQQKFDGYCSDIFTSNAVDFLEKTRNRPFFCYLAFNAPHTPLQVPERYYKMYHDMDPSAGFENDNRPFPQMSEKDKEDARRVYAMVTNIDDNIGRILRKLQDLNIAENTVVIFMTDNGPQQRRYNDGMRGLKSTVYRGGVRVPFWLRYPALKIVNLEIDANAANIDVLPTLAEICNVKVPEDRKIDGISLIPYINGNKEEENGRALFYYWSRHSPELYNNVALQKGRYKLVGNTEYNSPANTFELYDLEKDPCEQNNIVKDNPERAEEMKKELDLLFWELAGSEHLVNRPRIEIGSPHENPVILNRNDADGHRGIWEQEEIFGFWRVTINKGRYNMRFKFIDPVPSGGKMMVETGNLIYQVKNDLPETNLIEMKDVLFPSLKCDFVPFYLIGEKQIFPLWVEIKIVD